MKKIISFSLWGDNPKYTIGAIENAKLAKTIYPDWVCRFYVGTSTPDKIWDELYDMDNTEMINMDIDGDWSGMFWRFYPASENDVDVFIVRDTDSRLSNREKEAVDEWLSSDKGLHIMRDHPYHNSLIMGGMWGMKKNTFPKMKELIGIYKGGDFWQVDQNFLNEMVYPLCKNNTFIHDEFMNFESWKKPFPSERKDKEFVGDVFDEKNVRNPEYYKFIP
jgi:protein O-GlcNAc transferase